MVSPANVLFLLPGLVVGITVHEAGHALTAKWLGDYLPQRLGRISLNPFRHLSLLGTLVLFVLGFGWGKPVPINLYNFKRPRIDYLLCSLAGPVSNLLLCAVVVAFLFLRPGRVIEKALLPILSVNIILAVINLLPIPPLDGSKIWPCLIPRMRAAVSGKWTTFWVVVLVVGLYSGVFGKMMWPTMNKIGLAFMSILHYSPRPEGFPEVVSAPQGAYLKTYYVSARKGNDPNFFGFGFLIERPYPAKQLITFLETNLRKHDYRRLSHMLYEPNNPADNCWHFEKEKDHSYYVCRQRWIDNDGELISVEVRYIQNVKDVYLSRIAKVRIALDKDFGSSEYLSEYKRLHPDEFEGWQ